MKRTICVLIALAAGCLDAPPDTSVDEQAVCRDDPDTCPGGHPINLKQFTLDETYGAASYYGVSVVANYGAHCDASHCWAAVAGYNVQIRADCYDFVGVEWCDFTQCDGNEGAGWENCHDIPPPHPY